ncbi:MAG: GGDEF domain-containing protein [Chloroflexi bacterium]|nr:GGDEF domain-containing protein [Chloroflexota bacterium]
MPVIDLNILLAILVAANVVLIVVSLVWSRVRRRRTKAAVVQAAPVDRQPDRGVVLSPSAIGRGYSSPASEEPDQLGRKIDRLTGLLSPTDWNRLIVDEDVRHARYKRPATVVVIELDGFDRFVGALGQLAADRVILAVSDAIRRHSRKADHIARLGPSRFGVLLPETDEVAAVNYVERVRQASDLWLESGAIALRLAIGWASPVVDSSLTGAQAQAIERMFGEMLRGALREHASDARTSVPVPGFRGAPSAV